MDERVQQQLLDDVQRQPVGRHVYRLTWTDNRDRQHTNMVVAVKRDDGSVFVDRTLWNKVFNHCVIAVIVTAVALSIAMVQQMLTPIGYNVLATIQAITSGYVLYACGVSAIFHDHRYIG